MGTFFMQMFLDPVAAQFAHEYIAMIIGGASNRCSMNLRAPDNIPLIFLPPYSPELNPKENIWDQIARKASKISSSSVRKVEQKPREAVLMSRKTPR